MNHRIKLLSNQADRNLDELILEIKQVKNRNSTLEIELKNKADQ